MNSAKAAGPASYIMRVQHTHPAHVGEHVQFLRTCREDSAICLLQSYSHLLPCSKLDALANRVTAASGKLGGVCLCTSCCCWMSASKSSVLASRTCFRCGMATKACCRSCCKTGPSYKGISTGQTHHVCPQSGLEGEESVVKFALGIGTETQFQTLSQQRDTDSCLTKRVASWYRCSVSQ